MYAFRVGLEVNPYNDKGGVATPHAAFLKVTSSPDGQIGSDYMGVNLKAKRRNER